MLNYIHTKNVALAQDLNIDFSERINLITGDNGLGKSFFLDLAWWALTRTWAGSSALPHFPGKPSIEFTIKGKTEEKRYVIDYVRENESWPFSPGRPVMPGIVIYIRVDGGFSVWDPARNYWRTDPGRPEAYHFDTTNVWDGLDLKGQRVCEGLERDWVQWQKANEPQFNVLKKVLELLSPVNEPILPGAPRRVYLGEGRDRPTLQIGDRSVPAILASAGVKRILALAYFLVWSWHEHRVAADLLGKTREDRFVILFDEPETHLHPRWQRTILPSILEAVSALSEDSGADSQLIVATHSPMIAASLEPHFDERKDDIIHLDSKDGTVFIEQGFWAKQGDASSWLVSEIFGLEQARSLEAERAIEAAEVFMRDELEALPSDLDSKEKIHKALQNLLPAHDTFWPRWIVKNDLLPGGDL